MTFLRHLLSYLSSFSQLFHKHRDAGEFMPADSTMCWLGNTPYYVRDEDGFLLGVWPVDSLEDLPAPSAFSPEDMARMQ